MSKFIINLIPALLLYSTCISQIDSVSADFVKYTPAFKFKDGIFINFEQVKKNNPIPKAVIVSENSIDDYDFFEKITENFVISFYDQLGNKKNIETEKIWGYSKQGILYVNYNDEFNRIPVVGSISHFISHYVSISTNYVPYGYGTMNIPVTQTEIRQYLFDFDSGKIMDFDYKTIEILLMKDAELYDEFNKLGRRKKTKLKFLYVRKFNDKHPLYIHK